MNVDDLAREMQLVARAEAAEARLAKAERALEEAGEVIEPFAQRCSFVRADDPDDSWIAIRASNLRAARKWMEERHD